VKRDSDGVGGIGSEELVDEVRQACITAVVVEMIPHRDRHEPVRPRDAPDLAERRLGICEVHQRELADKAVERMIGVGQLFGGPDPPLDLEFGAAGDGEHALVGIECSDVAAGADAGVCGARQHARAAPDVEYTVPRPNIGGVENDVGPLLKQGWHEERLVDLGGAGRHLTSFGVAHGVSPS
jgi:hypothetical protein